MYDFNVMADAYKQMTGAGGSEPVESEDLDDLYSGLADAMRDKPEVWH